MEIQSLNPTSTASFSSAAAPDQNTPRAGASALSSDFETFLLMLTTQMENQDPLNPIESQDFAVQLATFSGVEQQVRTNQLLESLTAGIGMSGITQLAGWVGMEVRVSAPANFDGSPITLAPSPDPASESATLIVRDELDRVVSQETVPLGVASIEWAGVRSDGTPLPPGLYTFELESRSGGQLTSARPVEHYAMVTEARQGTGGIEVVLQGGASVPVSDVSALRLPVQAGSG